MSKNSIHAACNKTVFLFFGVLYYVVEIRACFDHSQRSCGLANEYENEAEAHEGFVEGRRQPVPCGEEVVCENTFEERCGVGDVVRGSVLR